MFIGHFGIGFAAKRVAPGLSLGTAFLAAQWIDLVWPTFLLLGLEQVRIQPGATVVTPLVFEHYPLTHSLLAAVGWGVLVALAYATAHRKAALAAVVAGALVASHWFLDAIVHVPDLPLAPGGSERIGLGLWNSLPATLAVELPLFALGVWLYARGTWDRLDTVGRWAFGSLVALLALIQASNLLGPPPPSVQAIAWVGQAQWLLVAWGYWIESRVGRRATPRAARAAAA